MFNVHAKLPDPEPERKEGTFFEYLNTEQSLIIKEAKCTQSGFKEQN